VAPLREQMKSSMNNRKARLKRFLPLTRRRKFVEMKEERKEKMHKKWDKEHGE